MICPVTGTRCESTGCTVYIDGRCGLLPVTATAAPRFQTEDSIAVSTESSGAHAAATNAAPTVEASGTPRVDAVIKRGNLTHALRASNGTPVTTVTPGEWVRADFARTLERDLSRLTRELEEARTLLREYRGTLRVDQFDGHRRIAAKVESYLNRTTRAGGGGEG